MGALLWGTKMILGRESLAERIATQSIAEGLRDPAHQLQPASIDLTLDKAFEFSGEGALDYDNSERVISEVKELLFEGEWVKLGKGAYKVRFAEEVRIPSDLAAITFARSSLARCGCDLYNGWWDPGYHGKGEGLLVVHNPRGVRLKKGAKIAQLVFASLDKESKHLYEGMHKGENLE